MFPATRGATLPGTASGLSPAGPQPLLAKDSQEAATRQPRGSPDPAPHTQGPVTVPGGTTPPALDVTGVPTTGRHGLRERPGTKAPSRDNADGLNPRDSRSAKYVRQTVLWANRS